MGVEYLMIGLLYLIVINFISGFYYRKDARTLIQNGHYAVSERWLLFLALFGGSYAGMKVMRRFNYRKHASKFRSNFMLIVLAQIFVAFVLVLYVGEVMGWWKPIIGWGRVEFIEWRRSMGW